MNYNASIILDNQSFPIINWINFLFSKKYIILLSGEDYQKMTFRNRYILAGSNGIISLSIPLINGRNQKVCFKEVRIANNEKWQLTHWRTITACYNKSPFFEYYKESLQKFFVQRWEFLFDWNLSVLEWLHAVLKFPGELIVLENSLGEVEDRRNRNHVLIDDP